MLCYVVIIEKLFNNVLCIFRRKGMYVEIEVVFCMFVIDGMISIFFFKDKDKWKCINFIYGMLIVLLFLCCFYICVSRLVMVGCWNLVECLIWLIYRFV